MTSVYRCFIVVFAAFPLYVGLAVAQSYPTKPVRVIVAFPPGGANDVVARIVFQKMPELVGQQFVIDNRGGAGGIIGTTVVAKSPPDGYTILVQSATLIANPYLYQDLPYDTFKDLVGVAPMARTVGVLVVHPSMPVKSVKEFIALAKAHPGEIAYGSGGSGGFVHLMMALLASMTGMKMVHVPYKGGGPAVTALIGGETQAMIASVGSVYLHITSKRLRPLGVTSDTRMKQLPDLPAIAESIPGYEFTAWIGSFAPAGTPKAVVEKLNADIQKVLRNQDVANKLGSMTLDPMFMTPAQFDRLLRSEYDKYAKVIKISGARSN